MVSMYSTATTKSKRWYYASIEPLPLTSTNVDRAAPFCVHCKCTHRLSEASAVKAVSVRNARSHLKALLDLVAAGEEIVICRRGKVAARLVPPAPKRRRRPDLTAFRNTICLQGEPVSVTGRTHGSSRVLELRRHERDGRA